MLSSKTVLFALFFFAANTLEAPTKLHRREVPQEHSHEATVRSVRTLLQQNNPLQIVDPVFALLGNAAAQQGLGQVTDPDCLQQAVADQSFTNAKAAGDVQGQVDSLIFRALERNSGSVGATTNACTSIQAVNPEIAAIQQHQDPASPNASDVNKAIELELAKQIASVGGNPQDALKSATFAPGQIGDPTAKGNTCDDENDANGCIFTQNLNVPAASADEINAAVAGISSNSNAAGSAGSAAASCAATVTVTVPPAATATAAASSSSGSSSSGSSSSSAAAGQNLQSFTGALGGISAPPVVVGGRGFTVQGNSDFLNLSAALGRSCDVQHNQCANAANSNKSAGFSVSDCDQQDTQCRAAGGV
jgi:hypothetical protein